jgi:hypothetical protein
MPDKGPPYRVPVREEISNIIRNELEKRGVGLDVLVDKLKQELEANETKFFAKDGKIEDREDVIAWDIRQKARQDAHKLRGDYPSTKVDMNADTNLTVEIVKFGEQKEELPGPGTPLAVEDGSNKAPE